MLYKQLFALKKVIFIGEIHCEVYSAKTLLGSTVIGFLISKPRATFSISYLRLLADIPGNFSKLDLKN